MKILLIHATAGAGHMKAAEAIYNGLKKYTSHQVVLADALDYTNPFFKRFYKQAYSFLISKIPFIWGFFFAALDIEILQPLVRAIRRIYNSINARALHNFLIQGKFDYIISTHFLSTEVMAALKRKGLIQSRLITVITDYDAHRIWLARGIDLFCVATPWTKDKMKRLGVEEVKVVVTGIPTDERFSLSFDVASLRRQMGLDEKMFTVLMATGSFGIGPIEEIIQSLQGFQVIVISGHNQALFERLCRQRYEHVKVLGLVSNMPELMAVSNAIVTKPGGLSISEALVVGLPLIFFNVIPGQEAHNVKVLKTYGVGISCPIEGIAEELEKLRSSKNNYLEQTRSSIKEVARPSAVKDIIALLH